MGKRVGSLLAFVTTIAAGAYAQDGGQVIQGGATITSPSTTTTVIDQSTDRVIINWNGFSVGADSSVIFNQPGSTSVALNRVIGGNPSSILGSLSANGQIFLLNPNGIVFGQGSQVNVNGLVASTLSLADSDFMS
ncbi:MAG TPA: filamentous hemagglutinin N-terminal domain-containing protein, partial [Planctomycetota bacterium]